MITAEHLIVREMKTWRSYGIDGRGPIEDTLIKDLKDDHLLNILKHLEARYTVHQLERGYMPTVYETMHDEISWRMRDCWQPIS